MDFSMISRTASLLSRPYSEAFFRLVAIYRDISATEAAHRLDLHIKTAQDFLEQLYDLGYAERIEVVGHKRPYSRYRLKQRRIRLEMDLDDLYPRREITRALSRIVREKKNHGASFLTSRSGDDIVALSLVSGRGRHRCQRRLNLTPSQGRFIYFLPFPSARPLSIESIIHAADLDQSVWPEILDLVDRLIELKVIEELK